MICWSRVPGERLNGSEGIFVVSMAWHIYIVQIVSPEGLSQFLRNRSADHIGVGMFLQRLPRQRSRTAYSEALLASCCLRNWPAGPGHRRLIPGGTSEVHCAARVSHSGSQVVSGLWLECVWLSISASIYSAWPRLLKPLNLRGSLIPILFIPFPPKCFLKITHLLRCKWDNNIWPFQVYSWMRWQPLSPSEDRKHVPHFGSCPVPSAGPPFCRQPPARLLPP